MENIIGKHCMVNAAALEFTKDWYIINKKTHIPVLKSKRIGKIVRVTKNGSYYVLWDGNNSSNNLVKPYFVTILIDKVENISQQGEQC